MMVTPTTIKIGEKIKIKAGSEYVWSRVIAIDTETYLMPVYCTIVLEGRFINEKIATADFFDKE